MSIAGAVHEVKRKVQSLGGHDALDWFRWPYLLDWAIAVVFHILAKYVDELPVFQRIFSLDDPTISFPHAVIERVSSDLNNWSSILISCAVAIILGALRRSLFEIHQGLLVAFAARGLNDVITDTLKNRVGRLRPDFLERCAWDIVSDACTGAESVVKDGRRSFPSGHSSTAFVGMTVTALLLAGKTGAFCFSAPTPARSILASRLTRLSITILPFFWSAWVAITRLEDYRHHKEDVVVGSLIGILSAFIVYLTFWPSPFSVSNFAPDVCGSPRAVYTSDTHTAYRHPAYGPASQEELA